MTRNSKLFRVYLPTECLCESSAYAIGCFDEVNNFCCVTGVHRSANSSSFISQFKPNDVGLVGIWVNNTRDSVIDPDFSTGLADHDALLYIEKRDDSLFVDYHQNIFTKTNAVEFVLILYDSFSFLCSTTLSDVISHKATDFTNLEIITQSLVKQQNFMDRCSPEVLTQFSFPNLRQRTSIICRVMAVASKSIDCLFLKSLTWFTSLRFFAIPAVKTALQAPSTLNQLRKHFGCLQVNRATADICHITTGSRTINDRCRMLLDIFLGLCVLSWLLSSDFIVLYANHFISWAEAVAVQFESLLNWLMGVPAGLKVNEQLASFLGNFFLYHIFLWKAYLRTLRPFWSCICYYSCMSGCLGLTVQLSLVQDLISMMTVHIYCFYVYAARLYHLQILALSSLWRLFCGKKSNTLRKRIDSASYDIDQLFLGTLIFTILLFTLPTTALFYLVFSMLRLLVLALQGVLITIVSFINRLPVYWLCLRFLRPSFTDGHLNTSIVQHEPLCMQLKLKPLSVQELFRLSAQNTPTALCTNSWSCLGKKLLLGQLIYPWIESPANPQ